MLFFVSQKRFARVQECLAPAVSNTLLPREDACRVPSSTPRAARSRSARAPRPCAASTPPPPNAEATASRCVPAPHRIPPAALPFRWLTIFLLGFPFSRAVPSLTFPTRASFPTAGVHPRREDVRHRRGAYLPNPPPPRSSARVRVRFPKSARRHALVFDIAMTENSPATFPPLPRPRRPRAAPRYSAPRAPPSC